MSVWEFHYIFVKNIFMFNFEHSEFGFRIKGENMTMACRPLYSFVNVEFVNGK